MYFSSFSEISFSSIPEIASTMGYQLFFVAQKPVIDAKKSIIKRFVNSLHQIAFRGIGFDKNFKNLSWLLASIPDGN